MTRLSALFVTLIFVSGCQPTDVKDGVISCNDANVLDNRVLDVNSLVKSHQVDVSGSHPLDMGVDLLVILDGVDSGSVADAFFQYPNGEQAEGTFSVSDDSVGSSIFLYNNFFEGYAQTNGLRLMPMTDYCLEVTLNNGQVIASRFNIERPDGSAPTTGEMFVHDGDFDSITGGGDYSKAMALPAITDATIDATELSFTMSVEDTRASEFRVIITENGTNTRAEFFTNNPSELKNNGSRTYTVPL